MCSKCYETTARLVSYCHPLEKVNQVHIKFYSIVIKCVCALLNNIVCTGCCILLLVNILFNIKLTVGPVGIKF